MCRGGVCTLMAWGVISWGMNRQGNKIPIRQAITKDIRCTASPTIAPQGLLSLCSTLTVVLLAPNALCTSLSCLCLSVCVCLCLSLCVCVCLSLSTPHPLPHNLGISSQLNQSRSFISTSPAPVPLTSCYQPHPHPWNPFLCWTPILLMTSNIDLESSNSNLALSLIFL